MLLAPIWVIVTVHRGPVSVALALKVELVNAWHAPEDLFAVCHTSKLPIPLTLRQM
jgi:hypothetical protein